MCFSTNYTSKCCARFTCEVVMDDGLVDVGLPCSVGDEMSKMLLRFVKKCSRVIVSLHGDEKIHVILRFLLILICFLVKRNQKTKI